MTKPKAILGQRFGGDCKTEKRTDFCRYYRHKPYSKTCLCEDCPDTAPCSTLAKGSGDSSKTYYTKKILNLIKRDHKTYGLVDRSQHDWPPMVNHSSDEEIREQDG